MSQTNAVEAGIPETGVATIAAAYFSKNRVELTDIPNVIKTIRDAMSASPSDTSSDTNMLPAPVEKQTPAVSIRSSVKPDYIVCLEDGKKMKMLKRHLMTHYNMTPDQYRAKWGLPADYPMVSPNYANQRRELAVQIGLGKSGRGGRKRKAIGTTANTSKTAKAA